RVGEGRIRVRECLVVVGVIGRRLVSARAGAELRDAQLLHHLLVVRSGCGGVWVRRRSCTRLGGRGRRVWAGGGGVRLLGSRWPGCGLWGRWLGLLGRWSGLSAPAGRPSAARTHPPSAPVPTATASPASPACRAVAVPA